MRIRVQVAESSLKLLRPAILLPAIVLGVATTLIIAWGRLGTAPGSSVGDRRWHAPSGRDWMFRFQRGGTQDVGIVSLEGVRTWGDSAQDAEGLDREFLAHLPYGPWRDAIRWDVPLAVRGTTWDLRAFGWPMRCVAGAYCANGDGTTSQRGWTLLAARGTSRIIVWSPIWHGLAFNTAMFAGAWCVVLGATVAAARHTVARLRIGRGLCAQCGYDLRGAREPRCPECGTAVRPRG
jgi:hypothetical protein